MRALHALPGLVVFAALAACSFDDSALAERICETASDCAGGACVDGVCVADADGDGDVGDAGDVGSDGGVDADADLDATGDGGAGDAGGSCEGDAVACDGERVVACVDGVEVIEADCADVDACDDDFGLGCVCREAACVDRVCEEADVRCDGAVPQTCDASGAWQGDVACADDEACVDGACETLACVPGATTCIGETRVVCDASGEIADAQDCSAEDAWCDASGGAPVCTPRACVPRSVACGADVGLDGDVALVCDDRGASWTEAEACVPGESTCVDGACRALVCEPGAVTCADLVTLSTCNALGTDVTEVACDGFCDGSGDVAACADPVCEPGDLRCLDVANVEECAARGSGWTLVETCVEGSVCIEGACVDRVCDPGSTFCDALGQLATCDADGAGVAAVETCPFRCDEGACVASVCGDGLVDPSTGETCDDGNTDACDGCEGCQRRSAARLAPGASSTDGPGWVPAARDFTLEAWIDARSDGGVMGLGGVGEADPVRVTLESGRVVFRYQLGDGRQVALRGQTPVVGAGWTHVAAVRFAVTGAAIFVDGELDGWTWPELDRTGIDPATGRIWVGSEGSIEAANMDIDELRVSSTVRYSTRFAPVRRHAVDASTVALFHFDEGGGSAAEDATGPLRAMTLTGASWRDDACYGSSASSLVCGDGVVARWEACDGGDGCGVDCLTTRRCRDGVERPGGSCYLLLTSASSWTNQVRACRAWTGGDLVAITSGSENDWVRERFGGPHWIGLNDRGSGWGDEGDFGWTTGESSGFSRWDDGEPNNGGWGPDEDCVEFRGNGRWNDLNCGDARTGICERPAE